MKRETFDPADLRDEGTAYYDDGRPHYANGADHDAWGEPDLSLLGSGRRPAPAFPLSVLGDWLPWVESSAAAASAPADYVATALLGFAGAAIANVRWPLAGETWSEPCVLNIGHVGSPSSGKSPAMDAVNGLVRYAEERMAADFGDVQADYQTRKLAAEARAEAWRADLKVAVKEGMDPPPMPADAKEPVAPVRPRIRVTDSTTEKLAALAAGLPRGLVLTRDELSGFIGGMDRYSGGGSDRALVIEMYGGRSYSVDRVKNPEPIVTRHLSIGIIGGIQPDKLDGIIDGPDDGLAARFLWCWPENKPAFRISRKRRDDGAMQDAFVRLTELAMGSDAYGNPEPKILRLTDKALDVLEAFGQDAERRTEEASGLFSGTLGKARGHALRLSCIIDHLWWAARPGEREPEEISDGAMQAAVNLMNTYFVPMAERVFGDASIPMAERRAMALAKYLKRAGLRTFNARDVRREIGGQLRDAAHMDEACEGLVEGNLIRLPTTAGPRGRGRPSKTYEVNPLLHRRLA